MAGRFRKHVADIVAGPRTKQREAALGGTDGEMLAIAGYDEIGSRCRESPCASDSDGNEATAAPSGLPEADPEVARHDQRAGGHRHGWKQGHRPERKSTRLNFCH